MLGGNSLGLARLRDRNRFGLESEKATLRQHGIDCGLNTQRPAVDTTPSPRRPKRAREVDWDELDMNPEPYESYSGEGEAPRVVRVARRVWVGNLTWRTGWQDLKDFFSTVGTVRYADVMREGGPGSRSKGCGIVEFETPEDAARAILEKNGAELDGRQIFVREDREDYELRGEEMRLRGGASGPPKRARADRPTHHAPGGSSSGVSIGRRVWVANLSFSTTWQQLKDHFRAAGHVLHADVLADGEGRSKGCGIVEFEHPTDALRAISMLSNSTLDDRVITVREDREDPGTRVGSRGGAPPPPPAEGGTAIVVHGLSYRMAWQELKDLCRPLGTVVRADVMTNPDGSSKGWGVVVFAAPGDAAAAIGALNGKVVEGRVLSAKYDRFAGGGQ